MARTYVRDSDGRFSAWQDAKKKKKLKRVFGKRKQGSSQYSFGAGKKVKAKKVKPKKKGSKKRGN